MVSFLCAIMSHERLQRGTIPCDLLHVFLRVDMLLFDSSANHASIASITGHAVRTSPAVVVVIATPTALRGSICTRFQL